MSATDRSDALVRWLCDPANYLHRPPAVELIETHISWVFLAGEFVYKLKKPVRFEFLDFATPVAREFACREELRLNRRLAAGVYLDVLAVTAGEGGQFAIGGSGEPVDWLVFMRRLPTERALDALHRRGELRPEHIERLAAVLAKFYRQLPAEPVTAEQYRERTAAHVRSNLADLLAAGQFLPAGSVRRVHAAQLQLLSLRSELFAERVRAGRIVEGHGDLRPEHVCLTDPPAIFDCIEFGADFRRLDVADELAFLAAECDFMGAEWVGPCMLEKFAELTGDRPPTLLVAFYKSYRACVRAKVAALRAGQHEAPSCIAAVTDAARHLKLAEEYLAGEQRPLVLLIGGLSGTGKTTLARALADALGCELLRTDVVRQELFGTSDDASAPNAGIYTAQSRQQVYDELFARAAHLQEEQIPAILDGTFAEGRQVLAAQSLARDPGNFLAIECICPPEVALDRIRRRAAAGRDASQADAAVYQQQRAGRQPWPATIRQVQVDTQQPLSAQVEHVTAMLRAASLPKSSR